MDSGLKVELVFTGGGSGALHALLSTPGASRFVFGAKIPYSPEALSDFLGEPPEQAVSPETAVNLAREAFKFHGSGGSFLSISCTAALATNRSRRGDDRAFICIKTAQSEKVFSLYFSKATRAEQEALLSDWLLVLIAQAVGAERGLMLPGSFNPIHRGHFGMLKAAEDLTGLRGVFELSAVNVDKPEFPQEEILRRASAILDIPVALTRSPRFTQKAEQFPLTTFVLGYDTALRLVDYAQGNEWNLFKGLETSFLVAGRVSQALDKSSESKRSCFQTLGSLDLPSEAIKMFDVIPEENFREDISSTELRGD